MFNFREYRNNPDRLSDWLPWAALVGPGIILNKDGSFQRTYYFRGPDLDSATKAELVATAARINNVLKRLGGGWAIFAEAQRITSGQYPKADFPDHITGMIDCERRDYFEAGNHYESAFYLTFLFLPPPEQHDKIERIFIDDQGRRQQ